MNNNERLVLTIGPNGGAAVYSSASATSRVLSGDGSRSKVMSVIRRLDSGGGFVGNVWVQPTNLTKITRS